MIQVREVTNTDSGPAPWRRARSKRSESLGLWPCGLARAGGPWQARRAGAAACSQEPRDGPRTVTPAAAEADPAGDLGGPPESGPAWRRRARRPAGGPEEPA